jgi:uncharacterized membrane protein (DUF106 family)
VIDALNKFILSIMDALLGWTLVLPRDLVLAMLALGTALLMVLIRKYTTNQNLLRRCADDKKRLRELKREAKATGDKDTLRRLRALTNLVTQKAIAQEWKPLLLSLLPVIMLTTWMWQRLAFIPPRAGEACVLRAKFPLSAAGHLAHVAPVDGVRMTGSWVKAIQADKQQNADAANAEWTFVGDPGSHVLTVRYEGRSYEHPVQVGARNYDEPIREHDQRLLSSEIQLRPVKLFGVVPGIDNIGIAPWMVAYLIIAIISVPLLKRVLRIY